MTEARRFGRAMRAAFPLEDGAIYLNHGTVGVTPRVVMARRAALLEEIEAHPARFMIRDLVRLGTLMPDRGRPPAAARLRAAAAEVAAFLGADGDGLAFVDNASSGVNAVMRSIDWHDGDELLIHDQAYGGVVLAAQHIARERGAAVTRFALPFAAGPPMTTGACVQALRDAISPRTRVCLLDHVSSETALVMPLAEMAAECRARGVAVLADGAHAPGAIAVDLDALGALGIDWYAANLHKWAFAPRGCGILWAAPERRADLHPAVISWGIAGGGWLQEFDWTGTRDPTPWLAAPAGLSFMRDDLGVDAMRAHNHRLAWQGAQVLAARWRQPFTTPESMIGCMATVPLPARLGPADAATAQRLRDTLLEDHRIEVPVAARAGRLWVRVSAQVYNDEADIEALGAAVDALA